MTGSAYVLHLKKAPPSCLPDVCLAETGSTDSQAEAGLGTEKRSLRIKRRQQRQRAEDPEQESQGGVHTNTVTADASSPVPSLNRTHDSSPTGRGRRTKTKTVGLRSRLADQSGPISDNSDNDEAAAADGAAVHLIHFGDEDEPSRTAVTGEPVASRNAQKRKRPQQQQSTPAVATASSVQPTISTEASDRLDADVMTEHSRSSDATPVGRHRRRGQGGAHTKPETSPLLHEQQTEQELDSGQSRGGALRRTGRQRKLTPAAAAAVEDFPSLYRNPGKPPATAQKEKNLRNSSTLSPASDTAREHDEVGAAGAVASPERGRRHAAPGGGGSQVQMSQLVRCGVVPAGTHELLFMGSHACQVEVLSDGTCLAFWSLCVWLPPSGCCVFCYERDCWPTEAASSQVQDYIRD